MTNPDSYSDNKINEFIQAIQSYLNYGVYKACEVFVSFFVITFQAVSVFNLINTYEHTSYFYLFLALMIAYIATDFVNGLVHMYMDNNTYYKSIIGPFIAAFHLHHAKLIYKRRSLFKVYFDESGTKFWLLAYLVLLVSIQVNSHLNTSLNIGLVAFGIFHLLQSYRIIGAIIQQKKLANQLAAESSYIAF